MTETYAYDVPSPHVLLDVFLPSEYHKFTGKERDSESGLDNFLSRYMSSSLGRFMRPDPAQFAGFENKDDPQAWNGYAYGRNNLLLYTDPDRLNHLVCDKDGNNCADLSDPQYDQFRKDNPNLRVTPSGDIYTQNENGTETKTGHESYYNEHALDSLINAGRTAQIGVNYAMLVTAPNYLLIGGAHFFLAGSSFTTFGSISILTNQAAGRIIGWGVGQTAVGVEATRELTQNLTPERVQEMINEGLNMPTVQNLLNQYGRAIAEGGAKLGNQQLQPRFELMQKIRDMWPAK
jgi:RHS repeat-associated protein